MQNLGGQTKSIMVLFESGLYYPFFLSGVAVHDTQWHKLQLSIWLLHFLVLGSYGGKKVLTTYSSRR